jgi:hypothetical protein
VHYPSRMRGWDVSREAEGPQYYSKRQKIKPQLAH